MLWAKTQAGWTSGSSSSESDQCAELVGRVVELVDELHRTRTAGTIQPGCGKRRVSVTLVVVFTVFVYLQSTDVLGWMVP